MDFIQDKMGIIPDCHCVVEARAHALFTMSARRRDVVVVRLTDTNADDLLTVDWTVFGDDTSITVAYQYHTVFYDFDTSDYPWSMPVSRVDLHADSAFAYDFPSRIKPKKYQHPTLSEDFRRELGGIVDYRLSYDGKTATLWARNLTPEQIYYWTIEKLTR